MTVVDGAQSVLQRRMTVEDPGERPELLKWSGAYDNLFYMLAIEASMLDV